MKSPYLVWCVVFSVFYPSPSWNLLPSMGIYMYLRLYDSFVTSYFKDIACVCVVCRCSCNFYYCPGRNQWFLLRDFPIEFQKCHFIPGFIFFPPHQWKILISLFTQAPVGGVEIIENTLFSLSCLYQVFLFKFLRLFNTYKVLQLILKVWFLPAGCRI